MKLKKLFGWRYMLVDEKRNVWALVDPKGKQQTINAESEDEVLKFIFLQEQTAFGVAKTLSTKFNVRCKRK